MAGDVVVGTMVVALTARTAQLEKDLAKAKAQIAEFGESSKRQSEQAAHATDAHTLSHGQLERAIRHTVAGVVLMSGAFKEAGEVGQLAAHSLGAFMAGGPLAGGITLATGLFGLLAKGTEESAKAAEKAEAAYQKMLGGLKNDLEGALKTLDELDNQILSTRAKALGLSVDAREFADERTAGKMRMAAMENAEQIRKLEQFLAAARAFGTGVGDEATKNRLRDIAGISEGRTALGGKSVVAEIAEAQTLAARLREQVELQNQIAEAVEGRIERTMRLREAEEEVKRTIDEHKSSIDEAKDAEQARLDAWLEAGREQDRLDKAHDAALKAWIDDMDRIDAAQRRIDDSVQSMLDGFANVKAEAEALTDEQMEIVRAQEAFNRALAIGADIIQAEAVYDAALAAEHAKNVRKWIEESDRAFERGQKEAEKVGKALAKGVVEAKAEIDPLFASMTQTLESGLADAIVDGFTDGGRNAADIFRNRIRSLEREVVGSLVHSALGGLAGLFGGGGGIASLFGGGGGMGGGAAATALAGAADCPT